MLDLIAEEQRRGHLVTEEASVWYGTVRDLLMLRAKRSAAPPAEAPVEQPEPAVVSEPKPAPLPLLRPVVRFDLALMQEKASRFAALRRSLGLAVVPEAAPPPPITPTAAPCLPVPTETTPREPAEPKPRRRMPTLFPIKRASPEAKPIKRDPPPIRQPNRLTSLPSAAARSADGEELVALTSLVPQAQTKTHADIRGAEERDLIAKAKVGDRRAMQTLLVAHERFVWGIAKRYFAKSEDREGVLQVARMGLMEGVTRFDLGCDNQLTTYASYWIHHYIQRHLGDNEGDISIPIGASEAALKAVRDGASSEEEIQASSGKKYAVAAWRAKQRSYRLDAPIGEDGETTFGDITPGAGPSPQEATVEADAQEKREILLGKLLASLPEKERFVIERRFFSNDGDGEPLDDVGYAMGGYSRERVRQLEVQAMERIRRQLIELPDEDADDLWGGWGDQQILTKPLPSGNVIAHWRPKETKTMKRLEDRRSRGGGVAPASEPDDE